MIFGEISPLPNLARTQHYTPGLCQNTTTPLMMLLALFTLATTVAATTLDVDSNGFSTFKIDGLVAATFTPFDENFNIDTTQIDKQAAWLNFTGVRYAFVSGTTGESVKLTLAERYSQAEAWLTVAPKYNLQCIIHVGDESIENARAMAVHAEKHGAHAFAAMSSAFFKPVSTEALAQYMAAIASAAPTIPFLYYHIPSMTGVAFADGMFGFVQEMDSLGVNNFIGVKYTGLYTFPGFMDATRILNYKNGKYQVLCGRDEMMLEALAAGITGFVGSQYNFIGDYYNAIRAAWAANNITQARVLQNTAIDMISAWGDVPAGVDGCKNVFNCATGAAVPKVGDARLPSVPITDDAIDGLTTNVQHWCKSSASASKTHLCTAMP